MRFDFENLKIFENGRTKGALQLSDFILMLLIV